MRVSWRWCIKTRFRSNRIYGLYWPTVSSHQSCFPVMVPIITSLNDPSPSAYRKRKRDSGLPEKGGNKRPKGPQVSRWNSTATHHSPGFWDTLSHIFLTRRAVQEFDRRNALAGTSADKTLCRSSRFPGKRCIEGSTLRKASPALKRFARTGGPDLSDIQGVGHTLNSLVCLCDWIWYWSLPSIPCRAWPRWQELDHGHVGPARTQTWDHLIYQRAAQTLL